MQPHVEPPPIPLIKNKHDNNLEKDFVKIKLHRDPTSSSLDLYGFKISLFDSGETEEFLLFVRKFNITLAASGTLPLNIFVLYSMEKRCVRLTRFLLTWKV